MDYGYLISAVIQLPDLCNSMGFVLTVNIVDLIPFA